MRKWIGACLTILLLAYPCITGASGASSTRFSESELDTYLLAAGYPMYVIEKLDSDLKIELFMENASLSGSKKAIHC